MRGKETEPMFALPLARWFDRRGIHFSWVVMAIVFLTMLTSSAALGLPGAFLRPLSREFGWTTEQISSAMALRFLLFGLIGPFAAVLMERYGLRRIVCIALALIASGLVLATRMTALWQLVLLWGLVLGVGSGLTALVLGAPVPNRWFEQRRGLVMGMLPASSATGQLIFLPIAASLIEHHGWRLAVIPVMTSCIVVATLAFCLLRDRPGELGLGAFGADPQCAEPAAAPWRPGFAEPLKALASASRNGTFWVLFGTFFVCGLSTNGLIQTHFISLCGDYCLAPLP